MQINKKKILYILNILLISIKQKLNKLEKQFLSKILKDILLISLIYQSINILKLIYTIFCL